MASNTLPKQIDRLFTLCEDMEDGLTAYEAAIGILQNTLAVLSNARNAAVGGELSFQAFRASKPALTTAQTIADSAWGTRGETSIAPHATLHHHPPSSRFPQSADNGLRYDS